MRRDMAKKFLEPSGGKKMKFPRSAKKLKPNGEDNLSQIACEGMKKVHEAFAKVGTKHVGTDFALMRRFLRSHKGKPWDDVYSEICKETDSRSYQGHHLREWLDYLVTQNCFMKDGEVYDEHGHRIGMWWCQFYVHPEKKTLEWIEPKRKYHKEKKTTVFEMDGVLYHEHEGIWYRVTFKPVPVRQKNRWGKWYDTANVHDAFMLHNPPPKLSPWSYFSLTNVLTEKYGLDAEGTARYCATKQSANGREIEKLKSKYKKDLVA